MISSKSVFMSVTRLQCNVSKLASSKMFVRKHSAASRNASTAVFVIRMSPSVALIMISSFVYKHIKKKELSHQVREKENQQLMVKHYKKVCKLKHVYIVTSRRKGTRGMRRCVVFCNLRISLSATVPGLFRFGGGAAMARRRAGAFSVTRSRSRT